MREPGGNIGKAATARNHRPSRLDLRYEGVVPLRFRRDLDRPARTTYSRPAGSGRPTDEHRPGA